MTTQARELAKIVNNAGDLFFVDDVALASDGAVLNFGADNDVTLTHVADTGLLINSTRQLQFGDSGTYIHQSADGVLDLVSDTEIELNATTLDINANVDISGTLTVAGALDFGDLDISNVGSIALDTITNDGTDITLDSSGDIVLDADGGDIKFKDDGTEIAVFENSSSDLQIKASVQDKDIKLQGNDGGSVITALTLDMSDAGTASFNHDVKLGDNGQVLFGAGNDLTIYHDGSDSYIKDTGTGNLLIQYSDLYFSKDAGSSHSVVFRNSGDIGFGITGPTFASGNGMHFADGFAAGFGTGNGTRPDFQITGDNGGLQFICGTGSDDADVLMTTAGNVGIGTTSPGQNLTVSSSGVTYSRVATSSSSGAGVQEVVNSDNNGISIISYSASASGTLFGLNRASTTFVDSNQDTIIGTSGSKFLSFATNSSERMRIDSSGNIGMGTSSPDSHVTIDGGSDVKGELNLRSQSAGTTYNGGTLRFKGYHSTASDGSRIWFEIRGQKENNTGGDVKGRIEMYINPGNNSMTEVMKIESNGDMYTNDGTVHSLASDSRVKSDVADLTDGLTILNQLRPVTYKYNTKSEFYNPIDETTTRYGFIADEVKTVAPQYIKEGEGKVDGVDVDDFKTLSQTKMIPMLVKAIQELKEENDSLKSRIETLEG
tara:strand:- start:2001 stop:3980 length:1980 start_codon:yes stop_codon:yes gene_type:complete